MTTDHLCAEGTLGLSVCMLVQVCTLCDSFARFAPESLDELTSMVVQLFGEVENKNVPIPEFPEHPFQEEQLKVSLEWV